MARPGRPRKDGPREPSGRPSRSGVAHAIRSSKLIFARLWDSFVSDLFARDPDRTPPGDPPLLMLAWHGKIDRHCFDTALVWAATLFDLAPRCLNRESLLDSTGFDFGTKGGRTAARRVALNALDRDAIDYLDRAFTDVITSENVGTLAAHLEDLWTAWCCHGRSRVT
jgi:hypothetical protein